MTVFTIVANGHCHDFLYLFWFSTNYNISRSFLADVYFATSLAFTDNQFVIFSVAMEPTPGPSFTQCSQGSLNCDNCYISYGDFCVVYSGKVHLLIAYAQRHGLILPEKKCPNCENVCRIDFNRLLFRCDRSVVTRGKRKRCNFTVSCFKGKTFII